MKWNLWRIFWLCVSCQRILLRVETVKNKIESICFSNACILFTSPFMLKTRNMKWLFLHILQTQIPKSIVNSEGMRRAAQFMVVPGYIIVLCQKLLLVVLNVAVSFLWEFNFFFFFLRDYFPACISWGKISFHLHVKFWIKNTCGGVWEMRETTAVCWSEWHKSSLQHYRFFGNCYLFIDFILYFASIHGHYSGKCY